jgi:hypothetical protein
VEKVGLVRPAFQRAQLEDAISAARQTLLIETRRSKASASIWEIRSETICIRSNVCALLAMNKAHALKKRFDPTFPLCEEGGIAPGNPMTPLSDLFPHPFEEIRPPSDMSPDGVRAWIGEICRKVGTNPTNLAKKAELAPSTLNKFLAATDQNKNLTAATIKRLMTAAAGLYVDQFGNLPPAGEVGETTFYDSLVRMVGIVQADTFQSEPKLDIKSQLFLQVPIFGRRRPNHLAFLVGDDHGLPLYPKNSILVVGTGLEQDPPESGDRLIVARQNQSGAVEMTVKRLLVSPSGDVWLTAISQAASRPPDIYLGQVNQPGLFDAAMATDRYAPQGQVMASVIPEIERKADQRKA